MSFWQLLITVLMLAFGTVTCRFLPAVLFPSRRQTPLYIEYLGRVLPYSMLALLVVYCYKDTAFGQPPYGIPALIAGAAVAALHFWKNNAILSIGVGTLFYMLLLRLFGG